MAGKPVSESMRRYEAAKQATRAEPRFCAADGCRQTVSDNPNMVFCAEHFRTLSRELRERLYSAQQSGDLAAVYTTLSECKQFLRAARPAEGQRVLITGKTFPVREQLRAMGGEWDPTAKGWWVPQEMRLRAEVLVGNADASGSLFDDESEVQL